ALKKIKISSREVASDGINLTALREIKFLQEVKHPHVTELLESIEEYVSNSTRICLAFEIMNTNLENIINNNWILHRDLNPNNLLIDKRGVLKIADFGLANFFGSPSGLMSHDVITRWHQSPELFLGARKYGTAVEIWTAGFIIAELLL
ncbi:unnamed protein product, partial [Rotaria sp. Silwood1]